MQHYPVPGGYTDGSFTDIYPSIPVVQNWGYISIVRGVFLYSPSLFVIRHAAGRFYQMPFRNPIVCPPSDFSGVIAVCPRSQYTIVFSFCQFCFFHSLKKLHFRQIAITHIVQIALGYKCNYFHHSARHDARQSLSYSEGSSFYLSLHWLRGDGHSIKLGLKLFAKNVRQRSSNSNPVLV